MQSGLEILSWSFWSPETRAAAEWRAAAAHTAPLATTAVPDHAIPASHRRRMSTLVEDGRSGGARGDGERARGLSRVLLAARRARAHARAAGGDRRAAASCRRRASVSPCTTRAPGSTRSSSKAKRRRRRWRPARARSRTDGSRPRRTLREHPRQARVARELRRAVAGRVSSRTVARSSGRTRSRCCSAPRIAAASRSSSSRRQRRSALPIAPLFMAWALSAEPELAITAGGQGWAWRRVGA